MPHRHTDQLMWAGLTAIALGLAGLVGALWLSDMPLWVRLVISSIPMIVVGIVLIVNADP